MPPAGGFFPMAQTFQVHVTSTDFVTANRFVDVTVPDGVSPEQVLAEIKDYDDTFGLRPDSDFFKHQTLGLKVVDHFDADDDWAGDATVEIQEIKPVRSPLLSHGKVVVELDWAEFQALDSFAFRGIYMLENDPDGLLVTQEQQQMVRSVRAWLNRVRDVFDEAPRAAVKKQKRAPQFTS